tara:strand:- start:761 stop:1537 length:777 start_codon:yes stop_codon:yes gene_type:complete
MQLFVKNKLKKEFLEKGYCVFNIKNDKLIDKVNSDINNLISGKKFKTNSKKIFSYTQSPRIVESYKFSKNCKKLIKNLKISNFIYYIFGEKPFAFSSINFLKSAQQPLHGDYAHFGTIPPLKIVGAWIALEDINRDSGPLQIVPKSQNLNIYNFFENNKKIPSSLNDIKRNYSKYEKWVLKEIKKNNLKPIAPKMKKGDCILWAANTLHGSPNCKNPTLTRKSLAIHYTFKSVKSHFIPYFSNPKKNIYKIRNVKHIH